MDEFRRLHFGLGYFVRLNVGLLRSEIAKVPNDLGVSTLHELLRKLGISTRAVNDFEDGAWEQIGYDKLSLLSFAAMRLGIRFVETVESPLWETFRTNGGGTVWGGVDPQSRQRYAADVEVAVHLDHAGIPSMRFAFAEPNEQAVHVAARMQLENLLFIGSAKTNIATEHALRALWPAASPVQFLYPQLVHNFGFETTTVRLAGGRPRTLVIKKKPFGLASDIVIEHSDHHGVLAFAHEPIGGSNVSTLIVAGCSRSATHSMLRDLTRHSQFYRRHSGELEILRQKKAPGLFLFTPTAEEDKWQLIGGEPKRVRGRPPGSKKRK